VRCAPVPRKPAKRGTAEPKRTPKTTAMNKKPAARKRGS